MRKLQNAREHAARRAAAATALHTAAYTSTGINSRFHSQPIRHLPTIRRNVLRRAGHVIGGHGSNGAAESSTSASVLGPTRQLPSAPVAVGMSSAAAATQDGGSGDRDPTGSGLGSSVPSVADIRQTRVNRTEEMMVSEAIRRSIISEEERMRKEIKGARKEAKKRQKEAKKADKQAKKMGANSKSASAANLSLPSTSMTNVHAHPSSSERNLVGTSGSGSHSGSISASESSKGKAAAKPELSVGSEGVNSSRHDLSTQTSKSESFRPSNDGQERDDGAPDGKHTPVSSVQLFEESREV